MAYGVMGMVTWALWEPGYDYMGFIQDPRYGYLLYAYASFIGPWVWFHGIYGAVSMVTQALWDLMYGYMGFIGS